MEPDLISVLSLWFEESLPHFQIERYRESGWLGWIKCRCELKATAAVARIEPDKICLIGHVQKFYSQKHRETCPEFGRTLPETCYCGERLIYIADPEAFQKLKRSIIGTHNLLIRNKHDRLSRIV